MALLSFPPITPTTTIIDLESLFSVLAQQHRNSSFGRGDMISLAHTAIRETKRIASSEASSFMACLTPRSTRTQPAPAVSSNKFPGFFAPAKIMSPAGPVNFFR